MSHKPFTILVTQIIHIQLRFARKGEEMMKDSLKLKKFISMYHA